MTPNQIGTEMLARRRRGVSQGASPIPYDIATEVECVNWSGLVSDRVR